MKEREINYITCDNDVRRRDPTDSSVTPDEERENPGSGWVADGLK